jgi:hypothetical protein
MEHGHDGERTADALRRYYFFRRLAGQSRSYQIIFMLRGLNG